MSFNDLKVKALSLPLEPGVYLMRDKNDRVIYVGKAKKLKNRVSQYFQDTASHTPKTRIMVSNIDHFDVIVAASEFEALVLECSLIKRYLPKYNILLKDDKGYPYIRLNLKEQYPKLTISNTISDDGATYFGPYGSRGITKNTIEVISSTLKLPRCNKKFPRDIDKDRPCLNYHMNVCAGWCQSSLSCDEYRKVVCQVIELLSGNYKSVANDIKEQMLSAAENLAFEQAAELREKLTAVEALGKKQLVTAGNITDTDVIGYAQTEAKACFSVLHFSGGKLLDKDYEVFACPDSKEFAVSSLIKQYYLSRSIVPRIILLPFDVPDSTLFAQLLEQKYGKKIRLHVPQRGDNVRMVELAQKNAYEEAVRVTTKEEKHYGTIALLGKMLGIPAPSRIESFDISNISGADIVGGMVVFIDGTPRKSEYKRFRLKDILDQNDYASMQQVVMRRFKHYKAGDNGFSERPNLLLIDGGIAHASVVSRVLSELELQIPVFGMVKDDRHRTRALVTPDGMEISIDAQQSVFSLIGNIQEETHRFAISYHRQLRDKKMRYSELDTISGIGPKRKQDLLKHFKSLTAIKEAAILDLEQILPKQVALQVYEHFHKYNK